MSESERHEARRTWLTTSDVGELCGGVTAAQVRKWIAAGELMAFDASEKGAGRPDWRFRPEWVEAFRQKRTKNAA